MSYPDYIHLGQINLTQKPPTTLLLPTGQPTSRLSNSISRTLRSLANFIRGAANSLSSGILSIKSV